MRIGGSLNDQGYYDRETLNAFFLLPKGGEDFEVVVVKPE